jgi:protease stability complex PrcB-like protein
VTTGRGSADALASQAHVPFRSVAKDEGRGTASGRRSLTIRGERRWRKVWDELGDGDEPPRVDFAREMLIAVTQGRQPSSGHEIRIERIERKHNGRLVTVVEIQPAPGCPAGGVMTSPYHVVRVARSTQRVRFERRRTQRSC